MSERCGSLMRSAVPRLTAMLRNATSVLVRLRISRAQDREHRLEAGSDVQLEVAERLGNLRATLVELTLQLVERLARLVGVPRAVERLAQTLARKRFDKVVDDARLQAVDGRIELQHAGGHHHRGLRLMNADLRGEPESVLARKADVAQRDGRRVGQHLLQPFFGRSGFDHR